MPSGDRAGRPAGPFGRRATKMPANAHSTHRRTRNNPLGCLVVFVVAAIGLGVLPLLLWIHTSISLSALGIMLNRDHCTRATFQITEYARYGLSSGPDIQTRHYFHGTVNGTPQAMSVRFARYAPALAQIMASAPDGRTAVSLAVGVWYNPDMRRTLLAREQILIPDTPGIFESMASRLSTYALLWLGFLGYWTALGLFVRSASRRQVQQR